MFTEYSGKHGNDLINDYYLSWSEMLDVMSNVKAGKATASFVKPEHILYGSPKLVIHLHILFNAMIQHSYVPSEFLNGVISPLIKDTEGDHTDIQNYRGLTLSVIFANLFEHALLRKIGHLLETDSLQYGYKRRHSTSHAMYTLKSCVDYFIDRGSNVYAAFLDCSKGFDKVTHSGIFIKLIKRGVPLCYLNLLVYWYSNLSSIVKWNGAFSDSFHVASGVRQGGVLSPHLFAIYVDDLIIELRDLRIGCHILNLFIACILYADDICLLAPCRSALQVLLNKCESYGLYWCLRYNPRKSKIMCFGRQISSSSASLYMYGDALEVVNQYKYLGVTIVAGKKFSTTYVKPLMKFRSTANTILNVGHRPSEQVLMKLLYSICVPSLTYASEVCEYSSSQMQPLTVALNDCIRRIFSYHRWESVRYLRLSMGYPSITDIFQKRSRNFYYRLTKSRNETLKYLCAIYPQMQS